MTKADTENLKEKNKMWFIYIHNNGSTTTADESLFLLFEQVDSGVIRCLLKKKQVNMLRLQSTLIQRD